MTDYTFEELKSLLDLNVSIRDHAVFRYITNAAIERYLINTGWEFYGYQGTRPIRYYRKRRSETNFFLTIPEKYYADHVANVYDVVKTLGEIEERSQLQIYLDLRAISYLSDGMEKIGCFLCEGRSDDIVQLTGNFYSTLCVICKEEAKRNLVLFEAKLKMTHEELGLICQTTPHKLGSLWERYEWCDGSFQDVGTSCAGFQAAVKMTNEELLEKTERKEYESQDEENATS